MANCPTIIFSEMSRIDKCGKPENRRERVAVTAVILMMYQRSYISNGWVSCELLTSKIKELVVLIISKQEVYSRLNISVAYIMEDLTKKKSSDA